MKRIPILLLCLLIHVGLGFPQSPPTSRIWISLSVTLQDNCLTEFGDDIHATYGIDDGTNGTYDLREWMPGPEPPSGIYAWWREIPGRNGRLDMISRDYRSLPSNPAMKDTFKLRFGDFILDDAAIHFRWPDSTYLSERCDSMFLTYYDSALGLQTINMFTIDSVVFDSAGARGIHTIMIYKYGVKLVDAVRDPKAERPTGFSLAQAFPNPFNSQTNISFSLATRTHVTLKVYDVLGREIAVLVDEDKSPGGYSVEWAANGVASGLYFYTLKAGEFTETKKVQLVK